jgi:signal transduction histidine kinase
LNVKEIISSILTGIKVPANITVDVSVNTDLEIESDQTFLRRILQNLITNAIQAMPSGGKLTIDAFKDNNNIDICVRDTGVGISEEAKAGLFKPLFTTKAKGQGLGLAVVKRLVESLNGTITFESEKGKGTRFTVEFPAEA